MFECSKKLSVDCHVTRSFGVVSTPGPCVPEANGFGTAWLMLIREEGQLYEGGPIWRIEQISPRFSR